MPEQGIPGMEGMTGAEGLPPEMMGGAGAMPTGKNISPDIMASALAILGDNSGFASNSPFGEMKTPVNLLGTTLPPPTPRGIPAPQTTNPRGMNRTGKVNTNIPLNQTSNPESSLLNRAFNIQR